MCCLAQAYVIMLGYVQTPAEPLNVVQALAFGLSVWSYTTTLATARMAMAQGRCGRVTGAVAGTCEAAVHCALVAVMLVSFKWMAVFVFVACGLQQVWVPRPDLVGKSESVLTGGDRVLQHMCVCEETKSTKCTCCVGGYELAECTVRGPMSFVGALDQHIVGAMLSTSYVLPKGPWLSLACAP